MIAAQDERHKALLTSFLKEVWSEGDIERSSAYLAETDSSNEQKKVDLMHRRHRCVVGLGPT
jgi:hypothetical protein